MIVLEASETNFSLPQHKKGSNTQRLDVEIPRKKAPNCKGSPSISQLQDLELVKKIVASKRLLLEKIVQLCIA